jgi:hypothetical protein
VHRAILHRTVVSLSRQLQYGMHKRPLYFPRAPDWRIASFFFALKGGGRSSFLRWQLSILHTFSSISMRHGTPMLLALLAAAVACAAAIPPTAVEPLSSEVALAAPTPLGEPFPCTYTAPDGTFFDFSTMTVPGGINVAGTNNVSAPQSQHANETSNMLAQS